MVLETDTQPTDARITRTRTDVGRAALEVLTGRGWEALTHANIARESGYSKSTIYTHWPARTDLVTLALDSLSDMPHAEPTGDLATDLGGELRAFRAGVIDFALDRVLITMAEWGASVEEVAAIRDRIVADGEAVNRSLLARVTSGDDLEAAVSMLSGLIVCPSLMYGAPPGDAVIDAGVAIVLRGLGATHDH